MRVDCKAGAQSATWGSVVARLGSVASVAYSKAAHVAIDRCRPVGRHQKRLNLPVHGVAVVCVLEHDAERAEKVVVSPGTLAEDAELVSSAEVLKSKRKTSDAMDRWRGKKKRR